LALEKYCIFLKEVVSESGLRPILEKSSRLILEDVEEGERTT
jgi:hypothetical protein